MENIYVDKKDIPEIFRKCYPDYKGNKFKICPTESLEMHSLCWDGGSRNYYVAVNLDTGECAPANQMLGNPFRSSQSPIKLNVPENCAIVEHCFFQGHDTGLRIYIHPSRITKFLPPAQEITKDQEIVLAFTRGLKSSYAGIKDYRFHEAFHAHGISKENWEAAKRELIAKGFLNKAGAITTKGKNVKLSIRTY